MWSDASAAALWPVLPVLPTALPAVEAPVVALPPLPSGEATEKRVGLRERGARARVEVERPAALAADTPGTVSSVRVRLRQPLCSVLPAACSVLPAACSGENCGMERSEAGSAAAAVAVAVGSSAPAGAGERGCANALLEPVGAETPTGRKDAKAEEGEEMVLSRGALVSQDKSEGTVDETVAEGTSPGNVARSE